ncbi:MAG: hypothetical protein KC609_13300, partial [Myxococcales bacterium]|nr:hypothetical protein [Myxococcales bacterium]
MADDFPLLTTLPEAPGLFEHRATLSYRDLRLRPFALLVDDFERFRLTYRLLLPRICGLVITYDTLYALERVDRFVWWLRVPTPCLGLMEEFLRGFLRTIEQLRDESRAKEKLQIDYERATSDISGLSDYVSIVEKVTRDELNERTRWMVGALSELVRFTAEKLEAAGSTDFPEQVTGFLCGPQFEYDGAALFIVREHAPELLALHGRAVPTRIQLGAAQIERGIWSEGPLLHSVFDVGGTTHLLVLACTKPLYK